MGLMSTLCIHDFTVDRSCRMLGQHNIIIDVEAAKEGSAGRWLWACGEARGPQMSVSEHGLAQGGRNA